nr:hypothetical protein [Marinobacter nanhaiticus]
MQNVVMRSLHDRYGVDLHITDVMNRLPAPLQPTPKGLRME